MIIALLLSVLLIGLSLFYRPFWIFALLAGVAAWFYFGYPTEDYMVLVIYLLGVILLIIELYVPDFGLIGISGIIAVLISLYLRTGDLHELITTVLAVIVTGIASILIPLHLGRDLAIGPKFVLETSAVKEKGYSSHGDFNYLQGERGQVVSSLRPVGKAMFADKYYEVISAEDMIGAGERIIVDKVDGARIYVRKDVNHERV